MSKQSLRNLTPEQFRALQKHTTIARLPSHDGPLPLSFAQQRLWFLAQMDGGSAAYHMPQALRLRGRLDRDALQRALDALVERHEALRTRFVAMDGEAFQQVGPAEGFALRFHDLAGQADAGAQAAALQAEEAAAEFDLRRGPLARGRLLRLADEEHVLLLTLHHIVSDGWSVGVFTRELSALYAAFARGEADPLPPLPLQYADYAAWQRQWLSGTVLAKQSAYWRETLAGAPALLTLPTDRPRPPEQDYRGGTVKLRFDAGLTAGLKALSLAQGSTLFMTLLAGWAVVLARLSGQSDLVIGTPTANRRRAELEGLIGFFVNTLALRLDLAGDPSVAELLARVRAAALAAQEQQDLPFEKVVEELNPARSLAHAPLFQAMFAWQNTADGAFALPGLAVEELASPYRAAKFDLTLSLAEQDGCIAGALDYASALFDGETAERYGRYLERVLAQMAADAQRPAATLELLDAAEREQLLHGWNRTGCAYPAQTLAELFAARAAAAPEAIAVLHEGQPLSYGELDRRANRLAHHLLARGIGPDRLVAICAERSAELVIGLAAVLKAGAAYVPLDPAYPADRLAYMLEDSAPALLLTQVHLQGRLPAGAAPVLCLDEEPCGWAAAPAHDPQTMRLPDQLAYVIYTSGSTGRPKGVAQTWRSLDNLIHWQLRDAAAGAAPARVLQFASISFDVSFQEIWSTLCQGGTLVSLAEERRKELGRLRGYLAEHGVRRAFLPAAVLQQLAGLDDGGALPEPCDIVTAGEALQVGDELRGWLRRLPAGRLYNQYGPTETHVVSQHALDCAEADRWPALPPIGRPIANARLYVLDARLEPVPVGVVGELYIAGVGLARGYLARPGLTAEKFLPDPYGAPGARMYRSGDLARRLASGEIDYVGRADRQAKIRGFRIEPGEIESVLQQRAGVREVAVLVREDVPGDKRLVAYLVGEATPESLREQLRRRLPEHMVPSQWVVLERMPLTPNGKLDRRALPAPGQPAAAGGYLAPRDEREAQMAAIWAEVLRLDRVGARDDFFALGGHSLLATRLVHAINRRMLAQLSLRNLFQHPVLADLAALLDRPDDEAAAAAFAFDTLEPDPAARFEPFPLTDIQEAYWVGRDDTIELGGVGAHGYGELRVRGFDAARFERALNRLIERHDMLRAVFHGDGTQQVLASVPAYRMPRQDLRGLAPAEVERRLAQTRERMSHQLLDAARWPLFEFALTELDQDVAHLHISIDALIVDAASGQILERELMQLYAEPEAQLPPLALTFRDYVVAEQALRQSPRYERALRYWRKRAATLAPAPALPLQRQPESIERPRFTRRDRMLPAAEWRALKAIGQQHAVTPSVLLLTAFAQVLALWSRQPRFTLSLPLFNRLPLHPGINAVIGDFTSLVLLEVEIAAEAGFARQARAVQEQLWQDIDHAAVSGVRVNRELSQARGTRQTAMPVVFNSTLSEMAPEQEETTLGAALGGEAVHSITQTPQVWIDHTILESEGRLYFNWDSIDELFPDGMMAAMFDAYVRLLAQLARPEAWSAPIAELLPEIRFEPTATALPPPRPLLHELFERQAQATPDAVAVLAPRRQLSYAALRREARRLAAQLQARGVRPNQLVAVRMERGWEQVVATLAVLYAGGAYLPLDPALPAERTAHILERAEARLALVQPATAGLAGLPAGVEAIVVEPAAVDGGGEVELQAAEVAGLAPHHLAYVIYTSGSTGLPKGVMIDHRGAVNTLLDINARFAIAPADRVLAVSSLSFDLSVFDFFGTLAAGAAVVLLEPELARDPAHWLELVRAHRVSVWNSVPALLGMLVEYAESGHPLPACLRLAMLSGDWIPLALPQRLRACLPAVRIDSLGGATEASIWSIHYPIGEVDPAWRSIPYGKPLAGQQFHVLDDAMRQRPAWVPGQLYIGGIGLALGYWRDEARTAASFVRHPATGERLYRTGDLGRYLPDGNIEFLGREDGQVKVQGYRVELGEIETALEEHPGVQAAAVRLWGASQGDKRLAAYVVAGDDRLDAAALADHLGRKLPAYMVPPSFTFLAALPLSANGKVDRSQLPEPAFAAEPAAAAPALDGPDEARLVAIVQGVLKRDAIAANANLLQLGASSIDIVRIGNALSTELGFRPRLAQLMVQPTLADLLAMFRQHRAQAAIAAAAQLASAQLAAAPAATGEVVDDPEARKDFKSRSQGRRRFADDAAAVALAPPADPAFARRYADYRSVRQFLPEPVALQALADLLACLSQQPLDGQPKFLYGSAGGAYPMQTYVYVKPGRVEGLAGGAYYHDPAAHRLVALGQGRELSADAYDYFVNRPVFEAAAFALFLVADLAAIEPLYGDKSLDFCHIEAGAMAQLLTIAAAEQRLGLCGIGSLETDRLEALFELGASHRPVYSMVGGLRRAHVHGAHPVAPLQQSAAPAAVEMEEIEI
ncbi:non-ribosomal peptide synthetase [Chitinimonas koreensis]|uniref:non-ribosomal peptide synthetase n=1 Tax=Chitinimonas koreensis TaxID=356302 RepID=UPI00041041A0|nr:non-ribosomal peptide synthetase [Chitinimonas koreensis]